MTAPSSPQPPTDFSWIAASDQIKARLANLRSRPDGSLLTRISGPHFVVITKEDSEIRLWLMEQGRPSTGVVQSEIDLDAPLSLIEGYTQAMTLALIWKPAAERIFFSGLGGGRVPLVLHSVLPQVEIFAAEIDPEIIRVAQDYFGLDVGNRIAVDLADGRQWLEQRTDLFDAIIVDVFLDNGYTPYRQATVEFFTLCRSRLQPDGVLIVNLLETDPYTARKFAALAAVFPHIAYVPVDEENTIAFAWDTPEIRVQDIGPLAARLNARWQLPFPFEAIARRLSNDFSRFTPNLDEIEPFHDASPPADYFDALPSLSGPFGRSEYTWPCPCGSGKAFGLCHGNLGV